MITCQGDAPNASGFFFHGKASCSRAKPGDPQGMTARPKRDGLL
ncbi:hypothetical protein [Solidesulfovibrio fructosivorans]|nr:hypothetical protein [Solidesulfovibrio fructosivorans]